MPCPPRLIRGFYKEYKQIATELAVSYSSWFALSFKNLGLYNQRTYPTRYPIPVSKVRLPHITKYEWRNSPYRSSVLIFHKLKLALIVIGYSLRPPLFFLVCSRPSTGNYLNSTLNACPGIQSSKLISNPATALSQSYNYKFHFSIPY